MVGTPEAEDSKNRMETHSMVEVCLSLVLRKNVKIYSKTRLELTR